MAGLSDEDVGLAAARPAGLTDADVGLAAPARPAGSSIAMQFDPSLPTGFEGVPGVGLPNQPAPAAPTPTLAPVPGGMEGDNVPGIVAPEEPKYQTPIASQFGGAPTTEPPPGVEVPNLNDRRIAIMARDALENGTTGEVINYNRSGQADRAAADDMFRAIVEARQAGSPVALDHYQPTAADRASKFPGLHQVQPSPYAGVPLPKLEADFNAASKTAADKGDVYAAQREANDTELKNLPAFTNAETPQGVIAQGIKSLTGSLMGGFGNVENLVGGPGKGIVKEIGEGAVKRFVKEVTPGAIAGATGGAIGNPVVQAGRVSRGEQEGFDPAQLGENVVLGTGVGAAFHLPGIVWRGLRDVISARRGVPADKLDPASIGPAEVQEAFKDPQIAALAKANGIESPADPRVAVLEDKLAARKGEEAGRVPSEAIPIQKGADAEVARRQAERAGVEDGTIDPAATNLVPRKANETTIAVDRQGGAFRADEGALAGRAKAEILGGADQRALPAPGRHVPTDEEIALQRADSGRQPPATETPPKLYGQEGRAPQDSAGLETQRQAGEAFDLAQRQRERAGPDVRDTQPAARPEGANPQTIHLDEGHPVEIVNRRMVPDAKGNMIDVATVRRYDPRTGQPAADHVQYDVPARQLKTGQYAQEPRMAQDFEARARVEKGPAGRIDEAQGLPRQTYRTTPPDDNAAGTARAARPDQPPGDHPGPRFSKAEEAMRDFADRQSRGEANGPAGDQYAKQKTSTKAAAPDRDGRYVVDENGYVKSDKEGPVRFSDQKQAAKWIINEGHKKSPDQVFEISNHPGGKGFTVRERGRTEPPTGGGPDVSGNKGPDVTGNKPQETRQIEGAREAPQQSYDEQVKAERDRLWSEEMPGYSREKVGNDGMVEASARETVMRREAAEQVANAEQVHGIPKESIHEVAQLFRRGENETPKQAWDRAVDRWGDKNEAEATGYLNKFDEADRNFDQLKAESGGETLYTDNHDAIHGPEVDHEAIPFDSANHEGTPRDGQPVPERRASGADGENGREAAGAQARSEGADTSGQAGSGRETASGYSTDAGPDGKRQTVIPGAERLADRAPAEGRSGEKLKGGDEPPPKGGLFDEDARNQADIFDPRSTFHANPLFDPAVWKWAGDSVGLREWKHGVADLFDTFRTREKTEGKKKTWDGADVARAYGYSLDGEFGTLAAKYKSPTIPKIANEFFARPDVGRGGAVTKTYTEALLEHGQGSINKMARIIRPLFTATGKVLNLTLSRDKAALQQIVKLIENPNSIKAGTPIHDAAAALKKLIDSRYQYMRDAGVDIGKVKNYFPHMPDENAILSSPTFVERAAKEILANRETTGVKNMTEARAYAEKWRENVLLGSAGVKEGNVDFVGIGGGKPMADSVNSRVLVKKSAAFFNDFYHTDPIETLTHFFNSTARRAEWERRMGGDKWTNYKQALVDEGNVAVVPHVVDLIAKAAGVNPVRVAPATRATISFVRTWGMISALAQSAYTSLPETAMTSVRAGDPLRLPGDILRTITGMVGGMKKEKSIGEDLGLLSAGYGDTLLGQRHVGFDQGGKRAQWVQNAFFRGILLEGLTHAQVKTSINGAQTFVRRLALDVADKGERATLSTKLLAELGVSDAKGFSEWVKRQSDGRPTVADYSADNAHGASYRTAMQRFSMQTIMRPNPSTFTRVAQHPLGGLMMQLQSFNYAFTKNVLARQKNLAVEAARPGSGLSGMERLQALLPLASMVPMIAMAAGVSEFRDMIYSKPGAKPMTDTEKGLRIASRSGITATLDPYINLVTSAKYKNEAASMVAGPILGKLLHNGVDSVRQYLSPTNSDKTNTAERLLAQSAYDLVIAPAATVAMMPAPVVVRAPLTQALKQGEVREGAVSSVAGPQHTAGGHGRPQRPTRK